ncbi:MAG: hypothetical protein ACT4PJ_07155 [Gemmatimonadaceae bacterium]
MVVALREANLDRFTALVDAAALRADDLTVLFDFVLAIADLWDRLGLRDPFVDAQLSDAAQREQLFLAARSPGSAPGPERERLAFYALRTLAALQTVVEEWRRQSGLRRAWAGR